MNTFRLLANSIIGMINTAGKNAFFFLTLACFAATVSACKDDSAELAEEEGFIIGFDQCAVNAPHDGFFIATVGESSDTLLTYNLPEGLFDFPDKLFESYKITPYFWYQEQRTMYKLKFRYRKSADQRFQYACQADINLAFPIYDSPKIEILSAEKIK